jgi:hypothetical protein
MSPDAWSVNPDSLFVVLLPPCASSAETRIAAINTEKDVEAAADLLIADLSKIPGSRF